MKAPLFEHVSSDAIFGFLEKIPYRVESYRVHDVVALQSFDGCSERTFTGTNGE